MALTKDDVKRRVMEEEAAFICLTFYDVFGNQKNITLMPGELDRAFDSGISLDASQVAGFHTDAKIDLLFRPDPDTLCELPQSLADKELGHVLRMNGNIFYPDGSRFENDPRYILEQAVEAAEKKGFHFNFGPAMEFYLFNAEAPGASASVPYDNAGYMDSAPDDRCEAIRRAICLDLAKMGIHPECAYHEAGPGQNKIKFRFSDPVHAADCATAYKAVVRSVASRSNLLADFSPKPLEKMNGNSMHVNMSVRADDGIDRTPDIIAGILYMIPEMTLFLNPAKRSYKRLGKEGAPRYISWSDANRSTLIRIPAYGGYTRFELRSPDNETNPYLAFALLIYASLYGIEEKPVLQKASEEDLFTVDPKSISRLKTLPLSLQEAQNRAGSSAFIRKYLPEQILGAYLNDNGRG